MTTPTRILAIADGERLLDDTFATKELAYRELVDTLATRLDEPVASTAAEIADLGSIDAALETLREACSEESIDVYVDDLKELFPQMRLQALVIISSESRSIISLNLYNTHEERHRALQQTLTSLGVEGLDGLTEELLAQRLSKAVSPAVCQLVTVERKESGWSL